MAEFLEVIKEFHRMCETEQCENCPINILTSGQVASCYSVVIECSERAEEAIMKWAKEHPRKTLKDRFFEMFPDAPKNADGTPKLCPRSLGWTEDEDCYECDCTLCWLTPWGEDNG